MEPLDAVRRLERRIFRNGHFDPIEATAFVIEAAMRCGVRAVAIERVDDWVLVYSEDDWLREAGSDVSEAAFHRISSYPAGGDNSMRPEVLLTAFTDAVLTIRETVITEIKGSPMADLLKRHPEIGSLGRRVVGFRTGTSS
jgi:hypothetical protein